MADYYPLIAKAVAGLDKSTGEARRALYDRARAALVAQLRGVTPALVESDITRERLSLEEAIRRVETEAARRSRTDLPPRAAPAAAPPRANFATPAAAPAVPSASADMRGASPQIQAPPPPAASSFSEPEHASGDAGVGIEPPPAAPAPAERPRWMPGSGPSISDRGLKGFRDVVTDKESFGGAPTPASKAPPVAPATIEPPPAPDFEGAGPRLEPPSERRRESARDRPRAQESRPQEPRPSGRRLEPPPPPPFLGAPGEPADLADDDAPDLEGLALGGEAPTRPPSSTVRQEDLRPPRAPGALRGAPPDNRRDKPPPEPRSDKRDAKRPDRWTERPAPKRRARSGPPRRKMVVATLSVLVLLAAVGLGLWNRAAIVDYFHSAPNLARSTETRDTGAKPKIADRIGGSSAAADDGAPVAQKVVLYEEDPNDPAGKRYVGSAVWRLESVPPAPGKPPDLAIRADIEIPEQKISARWSLRRNDDKALPASHTVEVMFTLPPDFPHKGITNIPGVLMKQSESTRGVPLAGLAVKVTNNFFLIGLSSVEADRARNIQLLKERAWFDIPLVYEDGRRAIIAIEKGTPGERAFARAFDAWGQ
jgi:hypothetical protein